MGITRREWLQQAGGMLAALGASQLGLGWASDRYQQAIAAPTARKLALLIGINQYPFATGLEGCLTDVELQRELLIQRFGFRAADVVVLTDWQATREAVTTAFLEHLTQQAKPGDVVVVHFSGLGSTVAGSGLRPALVMADGTPTGETPTVNDLLLETLGLLVRSLKTDRVTTILDTSYVYPGQPLQGNWRIRSHPNPSSAQPAAAELALQESLLIQLRLSRDRLSADWSQWQGLVIAAAAPHRVATEGRWNRFNAGLLTSALTQTLWQTAPTTAITISFGQVSQYVNLVANQQQPQLSGQRLSGKATDNTLLPYFVPGTVAADGAIVGLDAEGQNIQLWLGGLTTSLLEHYAPNSLLTVVGDREGLERPTPILLQLTSRDGFTARAKLYGTGDQPADAISLHLGQGVREAVRVLSRNIGLTVALDGSLERIERVDAISALTAVPRVSSAIAGEQAADFLFSKVQVQPTQVASLHPTAIAPLAEGTAPISYGLFTPGRNVILSSTGEGGEAVKVAVRRLVPKLQTLLATKLLQLTVNQMTTEVGVRGQLEQVTPTSQVLQQQAAQRSGIDSILASKGKVPTDEVQIQTGNRIRYRVENDDAQPLYPLLLMLDTANNLVWLHPPVPVSDPAIAPTVPATIAPQQSVLLPTAIAGSEWQLQGSPGLMETFLILSRVPFHRTLDVLAVQQRAGNSVVAGAIVRNPLEVVQAILQDLSHPTARTAALTAPDSYALDVQTWATFRFVYQLV